VTDTHTRHSISRRAFLGATAAASVAAVRPVAAQQRRRDDMFAGVRDIDPSLRSIPVDRYPMPFSDQEYADRLTRCRQAMAKLGIELLFVTWPEGMCYLHGYEVTWYRVNSGRQRPPTMGTAVHVDHDKLIFFGGENAVPSAAKDRRPLRGGGPAGAGAAEALVAELQKEGWLKSGTVVGLEYWSYVPPRAVSQAFEAAFVGKGAKVVDGSGVMLTIRRIKSPAEIAVLEHAAKLGDLGLRAVARNFKPGMSHSEVASLALGGMMAAGGEMPAIAPAIQTGIPRSPHLMPARRRINAGEPFGIDFAGVYYRYHAVVNRTFFYGEPSPELVRLNEAARTALDVLARTARAGTPVATVMRALREHYQKTGAWEHRGALGGYEIGIAFPSDWVGEFAFNVADESPEGVFEANLVTNYENILRIEGPAHSYPQLAITRDTIVYGASGARCLSAIPPGLIVLG
jgi:Xaa-Pro aminopeptidase